MFEPINTSILFKYRDDSENTESIIEKHALWFSSPHVFNDPFDCWSVVEEGTEEQKAQWISKNSKKNVLIDFLAHSKYKSIEQNLKPSLLKQCADNTLSQIRICSFSLICDNILMWSHYAKEHTGMCFMFDFKEDSSLIDHCSRISYVSQITPCNILSETGRKDLVRNCILSKYKDWHYEEEVRSIKFGDGVLQSEMGQNYDFNPMALKKIIFGCRATAETIEKYASLCQKNGMQHVAFSRMKQMEDGTFGLLEEHIQNHIISSPAIG